jgi:Uma2 family endonuclease
MNAVIEQETNLTVKRRRFTTDEFQEMVKVGILPEEHGWEVIDGYLVDKMSIGTKHASVVKRLNRILNRRFGENLLVSVQDPIHLNKYNEPEPDIALLVRRDDEYQTQHPLPNDILAVIEVSDSTLKYDREIKKNLYAEAGIVEFWLIDISGNTIEVYSQPRNGTYRNVQIFGKDETVNSITIEKLALEVNEIIGS